MSRGKAPVAGNLPARSSKPALLDDAVEPRVPSLPPKWDTSPNYSDWFPGDLVLLSASRWSLSSKAIVGAQRLLRYSKEHAAWTHAAVYADKGEVVEAVTSPGVRNAPLGKTLQRRSADVRRFAKVTLRYAGSAQMQCLELMAKKFAVPQSASGDMPDSGLDVLNQGGDSIEVALAKRLVE